MIIQKALDYIDPSRGKSKDLDKLAEDICRESDKLVENVRTNGVIIDKAFSEKKVTQART